MYELLRAGLECLPWCLISFARICAPNIFLQADRGGRGSKNYAARVALARNLNAHHKVNVQESESESEDEVFSSSANESLQLVWGRRKGKERKSKEKNEDQSGARKLRNIIFSWNAHAIREKVLKRVSCM